MCKTWWMGKMVRKEHGGSGRRWEKLGGFETSWEDLAGGRSNWEELGVVNKKTIDNMNALVTIRLLWRHTQTMAILIRRIILLGTCLQLLSVTPWIPWWETNRELTEKSLQPNLAGKERLGIVWIFETPKHNPSNIPLQEGHICSNRATSLNPFQTIHQLVTYGGHLHLVYYSEIFKGLVNMLFFKINHNIKIWNQTQWQIFYIFFTQWQIL